MDQKFQFSHDSIESLRLLQSNFAKERNWDQFHTPRNLLLALVGEVGELAEMFKDKTNITTVTDWKIDEKIHLGEELSDVYLYLMRLSEKCCIDFSVVTSARIQDLCKTSSTSKVNLQGQHEPLLKRQKEENDEFKFSNNTLESIRTQLMNYNDSEYLQDIVLTIVTEVGELAELFQWKGEVKVGIPCWDAQEKENLGQELGDVLINLIWLADKCCVDLPNAIKNKILKNAKKYPVHLVHGSSKKYTEYKEVKGKLVVAENALLENNHK